MRAAGIDHVALAMPWYQADAAATTIAPEADHTPSDASVLATMALARRDGLGVVIKPQLVLDWGYPADPRALPPDASRLDVVPALQLLRHSDGAPALGYAAPLR